MKRNHFITTMIILGAIFGFVVAIRSNADLILTIYGSIGGGIFFGSVSLIYETIIEKER